MIKPRLWPIHLTQGDWRVTFDWRSSLFCFQMQMHHGLHVEVAIGDLARQVKSTETLQVLD